MVSSSKPRRILIVDGSPDSAEILTELLQTQGYEVRKTFDASTGLAEAARFYPHVICSNIRMAKVSGLDLAVELRKSSHSKSALLIAITGLSGQYAASEITNAGFDINLCKPFAFEKFFRILDDFFDDIENL